MAPGVSPETEVPDPSVEQAPHQSAVQMYCLQAFKAGPSHESLSFGPSEDTAESEPSAARQAQEDFHMVLVLRIFSKSFKISIF